MYAFFVMCLVGTLSLEQMLFSNQEERKQKEEEEKRIKRIKEMEEKTAKLEEEKRRIEVNVCTLPISRLRILFLRVVRAFLRLSASHAFHTIQKEEYTKTAEEKQRLAKEREEVEESFNARLLQVQEQLDQERSKAERKLEEVLIFQCCYDCCHCLWYC